MNNPFFTMMRNCCTCGAMHDAGAVVRLSDNEVCYLCPDCCDAAESGGRTWKEYCIENRTASSRHTGAPEQRKDCTV